MNSRITSHVFRGAFGMLLVGALAVSGCKKDKPEPEATPTAPSLSLASLDQPKLEANAKAAGYTQSSKDDESIDAGTIYSLKYEVEGKDVFVNLYDFSQWKKAAAKPSLTLDGSRILYVSAMNDSGSSSAELAEKVKAKGLAGLKRADLEGVVKGAGWKVDEGAEDEDESINVKSFEVEAVRGDDAKGDDADATVILYDFSKPLSESRAVVKDDRALVVGCKEDVALAQKVLQKLAGG
ncbi:MAG: hypothetical protein AB7K71_06625 [Polyangiaceae bacterium]